MKKILYSALLVSLVTFGFWEKLPKGFFYVGNALFVFMLCLYLYLTNRNSFICFLLVSYSLNNLADELFFNPTVLGYNELTFALIIPVFWVLKKYYNAGKVRKQ